MPSPSLASPELPPPPSLSEGPADPIDEVEPVEPVDERLEISASRSWKTWKGNPTPENLGATLRSVRPVIDRTVARYPALSPYTTAGESKRLAIQAIKTYDPAHGASLQTHVQSHLRSLAKTASEFTTGIDRTRTDRQLTSKYLGAVGDLTELNNREPTDDEIQDKLRINAKELNKMRRVAVGEMTEEDFFSGDDKEAGDPRVGLWADYIYQSLNPKSKLIFDLKTGRNGRQLLSAAEIGAKLGMSEVYVNRRANEIAQSILDGADSMSRPK